MRTTRSLQESVRRSSTKNMDAVGTIVGVTAKGITVNLSGYGKRLTNIPIVGGPVSVGETVEILYTSGTPIAYARTKLASTVTNLLQATQDLSNPVSLPVTTYKQWYYSIPNGLAAYDPYDARSEDLARINLLSPGTYDAVESSGGTAPTWARGVGWTFLCELSPHLKTNIIPALFDGTWSMFVLYDNGESVSERPLLSAGDYDGGKYFDVWSNGWVAPKGQWYGMGDKSFGPTGDLSSGVWAGISGFDCYHNGELVGTIDDTGIVTTATGLDIRIGQSPVKGWYFHGNIKRIWIAHRVITEAEAETLYSAMIDFSVPSGAIDYVLMSTSGSLPNHRVLTAGGALSILDGGPSSTATINLATPGTLTASTTNDASSAHTHAITASDDPGATASLMKTNSSGGYKFGGDLFTSTNGSNTGGPRTFGFADLSSGEASRIQFGDAYTAIQLAYGSRMEMFSYWGITIAGNREATSSLGFASGGATDPSLTVIGTTTSAPVFRAEGASGQSGNILEVRANGGGLLLNVQPDGDLEFHANNIVTDTTTGTKIGTATNQKIGFFNATPIVQPTEITDELTTLTFTAPKTPNYAIQDLVASGYGFVTADEARTVLAVIANLQARVNELETTLVNLGLLADAD